MSKIRENPYHFVIIFLAGFIGVFSSAFLAKDRVSLVYAKPLYTLRVLTPADQIRNGGELEFGIELSRYKAGERLLIGASFDARKLKLQEVKKGGLGEIEWVIQQQGDEGRIIIRGQPLQRNLDSAGLLAVLRFRIDDKTGEVNEQGFGYTELCTLFTPEEDPFAEEEDSPTPAATATPRLGRRQEPGSGAERLWNFAKVDKSKLCIPLVVNGSPADKMDWVIFPVNYEPDEYDKFFQESRLGLIRLAETNLSEYKEEVLDKMNWYMLNPAHPDIPEQYRGKKITQENLREFLAAVYNLCPKDRYVVLVGNVELLKVGGAYIGGEAAFYIGFIYPAGGLYQRDFNTFAHEWAHAAAGLMDEYNTGQWVATDDPQTAYNCALEPAENTPSQDPCPDGLCTRQADDPSYASPCPKWDCSARECSELEEKLLSQAGCFPRCSIQQAYRPAKISIMDRMIPGADEQILRFNGPSLYSIVEFAFGRYR